MKRLIFIIVAIVMAGCGHQKVWEHQIRWANKVCEANGGVKQIYVERDAREAFAGASVSCNNGASFEVSYKSQMEAVLNPGESQ